MGLCAGVATDVTIPSRPPRGTSSPPHERGMSLARRGEFKSEVVYLRQVNGRRL